MGFARRALMMIRRGTRYVHDPNAALPAPFAYEVGSRMEIGVKDRSLPQPERARAARERLSSRTQSTTVLRTGSSSRPCHVPPVRVTHCRDSPPIHPKRQVRSGGRRRVQPPFLAGAPRPSPYPPSFEQPHGTMNAAGGSARMVDASGRRRSSRGLSVDESRRRRNRRAAQSGR
jgi:hypothetical protein